MSFTFENQGANTLLVYQLEEGVQMDSMSLGMLTNNKIPGFAAASFSQMDSTKFIKYNVSAKVSASQLFSGAVNRKRLVGVFSGIVDAMLSAEDYMLDPQSILLDMDYIFTDVSTCETVLICLPVAREDSAPVDLGLFFKNIIFTTQFDQTENSDHVVQILNFLSKGPGVQLEEFKSLLNKISGVVAPVQEQKQPVAQQPAVSSRPAASQQPVVQNVVQNVVHSVNQIQKAVEQNVAAVQNEVKKPPVQTSFEIPGAQKPAFEIPGAQPQAFEIPGVQQPAVQNTAAAQQTEKPISMFYLLQHYNKENAAAYKAQQEAKKAQKNTGGGKKSADDKKKYKKRDDAAGQQAPAQDARSSFGAAPGFEIPGMNQAAVPQQSAVRQQPAVQPQPAVQQPAAQQNQVFVQSKMIQNPSVAQAISFGETMVLGNSNETTVLTTQIAKPQPQPHLFRVKTNERIPLTLDVFRIGREKTYVNYCIEGNNSISRSHANVIRRNNEFFLVDTNSANHTYVNGTMICSNVDTKLADGDKIRFADEEFEFRMG